MKNRIFALLAVLLSVAATPALATPGDGDEIYGARVEPWEAEFEARYHAFNGGPADGEDVVKLEAAYGVNSRLRIGVNGEFGRVPGGQRRADVVGLEAIYTLGSIGPIEVAGYGEYSVGFNGHPDEVEAKILLQYLRGTFDARLNLIMEKELAAGEHAEFAYSARADIEAVGAVRVGVQAFGDLGGWHDPMPGANHFVGPSVRAPLFAVGHGPQIEIETGYLFALGRTRDDTKGQFRLAIELEF